MRRLLSMWNLLAALLLCLGKAASAQLAATPLREAGSSLDPSIRNEVEHASDLAAAWLASRQAADGSWGPETARVWRTSIALAALAAQGATRSDAAARAAVWLDAHPPAILDPPDAHAWRLIALLSAFPLGSSRVEVAERLYRDCRDFVPRPDAPLSSRLLWDGALQLAGKNNAWLVPASDAAAVASIASRWQPTAAPPHILWLSARTINVLASGSLDRGEQPLDWRRDLAQALINSQRRDAAGGAYWSAAGDVDGVAETAFGLLALSEI